MTFSKILYIIQNMKSPKTNFEFQHKIKVKGWKARLVWSSLPFNPQNPLFTELRSKGYNHIGTFRINPKRYTAGFQKVGQFKTKILTVNIIRLNNKRKISTKS